MHHILDNNLLEPLGLLSLLAALIQVIGFWNLGANALVDLFRRAQFIIGSQDEQGSGAWLSRTRAALG